MNCKVILLDSLADINLLKEAITFLSLPIDLLCFSSVADVLQSMHNFQPQLLMIGSGIFLYNDCGILLQNKSIPIIVLFEEGYSNILLKNKRTNLFFLARPFDFEQIPEMFNTALQFVKTCKEN